MKKTVTTLVMLAAAFAVNAQSFSKVEINPLQGSEEFIWTDSAKHVYGAGELNSMVELNGKLYFIGHDSYMNNELWVTDGTQQGTHVVKEINPNGGADINQLYLVGNKLVFTATADSGAQWDPKFFDLYVSDGTAMGTTKLAELDLDGNYYLENSRVVTFNNRFVFCTDSHIMVTDGTVGGTKQLAAIPQYAAGSGYCELNGKAYFILSSGSTSQLWSTDGSVNGTTMVKNLTTSSLALQYTTEMKSFNNKLYIIGAPSGQGQDLFTCDANGNNMSKVELTTVGNSYPAQMRLYNNRLWFVASNATNTNLYVVNPDNTVYAVPTAINTTVYGELAFGNDRVYFTDGGTTNTIYSVQAQAPFTAMNTDLGSLRLPYYWFSGTSFLIATNGNIYFAAYDSTMQQQLFVKGTPNTLQTFAPATANTPHPFNALLSCGMADMFDFRLFNNKIVMPANFDNSGRELWFFEDGDINGLGNKAGLREIKMFPNPAIDVVIFETAANNYCQNEVTLFDLQGRAVLSQTGFGGRINVKITELLNGEYISLVKEDGKTIGTSRLIINR